jgi:hypothetical protein
VGLCKNNSAKNPSLKFYTFPKDATRRKVWASRCGRKTATGDIWIPPDNNRSVSVYF